MARSAADLSGHPAGAVHPSSSVEASTAALMRSHASRQPRAFLVRCCPPGRHTRVRTTENIKRIRGRLSSSALDPLLRKVSSHRRGRRADFPAGIRGRG
jgi:hypothetical protein